MLFQNKIHGGKLLIFSIGLLFVLYALYIGSLLFFGTETSAKITSYRQEYGERDETIRNQYTYLYGYEFTYKGRVYSGTGQNIGDSVYLKNKQNHFLRIKFFPAFPQFSTSFEGTKSYVNIIISAAVGIILIVFSRKMISEKADDFN